ncbi:ABC-type thiamine transport system substrate-binding protein [Variovorax boronicumulans]|uniref:hypothetical protein n=1 Tax=Variovorax boronicumulans TaxID=436515 RepID=UPI002473B074|nr:hypothetical protein [Variovorax boronicumulans]MDH6169526.1 ABC-type thiamine transport system substrate-binding protein [Variovorax boronicumulans]
MKLRSDLQMSAVPRMKFLVAHHPMLAEQFLAYVIRAEGRQMIWTIRDMSPAMAKKQTATSAKK